MEIKIVELYRALCDDLGICRKTAAYVINRLQNEGGYVVTTLLPRFSKHVLSCIEQGHWTYFGTEIKISGGLPVIFRGYLLQLFVYDPKQNLYVVREDADPVSLDVIRQFCEYTYKLALPFSADQLASAVETFVANDDDVMGFGEYNASFVDAMRKSFETYYRTAATIDLYKISMAAHPGPGTFSGARSDFWQRNYRAPTVRSSHADYAHGLRFSRRAPKPSAYDGDPNYSEVLFVPKDSRGPRVISREPYNSLLFQMGYFTQMTEALEQDTQHRINFKSQQTNRSLAHLSSISRSYATIDLKDASDRVSFAIVSHLFRYVPLSKALALFRTELAKVPDESYGLKRLKKLAGMGSGFTFPTLALVIHLAICTHISARLHLSYRSVMKQVYVYGDDIIVPTHWYDLAVAALSYVGLVVNSTKSFRHSHFRESCGGDYYYGNDVTPVRLKLTSARPHLAKGIISFKDKDSAYLTVERHARELVKKQLYSAAAYVYSVMEEDLGPLPLVTGDANVFGRYTLNRDDVLSTLSCKATGDHHRRTYWVAKPVRGRIKGACPYQHLLRTVRMDANQPWYRDIFPAGSLSVFGCASRPRMVKVVRRKLPCIVQS